MSLTYTSFFVYDTHLWSGLSHKQTQMYRRCLYPSLDEELLGFLHSINIDLWLYLSKPDGPPFRYILTILAERAIQFNQLYIFSVIKKTDRSTVRSVNSGPQVILKFQKIFPPYVTPSRMYTTYNRYVKYLNGFPRKGYTTMTFTFSWTL